MNAVSASETLNTPTTWSRYDRLVVTCGAIAMGGGVGLFATLFAGRVGGEQAVVVAAPILIMALAIAGFTLWRAWHRSARGCATAAMLQILGVVLWPFVVTASQASPIVFWLAPALALSAVVLFASCWQGRAWAIYGAAAQAALLTALAAHQSMFVMLGA